MTDQGSIPPDFWQTINKMIDQKVAASQRAASIRNASLSAGGTFTVQGGAVVFEQADGRPIQYTGPVQPPRADGTDQPGVIWNRADGTTLLTVFDAFPTDSGGALNQAMNIYDRSGAVVFADDTNSGSGLARPYISIPLYPAALNGSTVTASTSFTDIWDGVNYRQNPRLYIQVAAGCDTSGATAQVQVLVNGAVWGTPQSTSFTPGVLAWGPLLIPGATMDGLTIQVQAKRLTGSGNVQVVPRMCLGMQS